MAGHGHVQPSGRLDVWIDANTLAIAQRAAVEQRGCTVADLNHVLQSLTQALRLGSDPLLVDQLSWARSVADAAGTGDAFEAAVDRLGATLRSEAPRAADLLARCRERARAAEAEPPSFLDAAAPLGGLARTFHEHILAGERNAAIQLVLGAADGGVPLQDLYLHVFQPSQLEVGRLWQLNRITVADEHLATASTQLVIAQLYPRLFASRRLGRTIVATCLQGDLHELGLRMVCDMFEHAGWDTHFLGASCPADAVLGLLKDRDADALAISVSMTTHLRHAQELIARLRAASSVDRVKVLVGGPPFRLDAELWRHLGADGSAPDCVAAVEVGRRLVESA